MRGADECGRFYWKVLMQQSNLFRGEDAVQMAGFPFGVAISMPRGCIAYHPANLNPANLIRTPVQC